MRGLVDVQRALFAALFGMNLKRPNEVYFSRTYVYFLRLTNIGVIGFCAVINPLIPFN